jgi:hypothetical protein
MRLDWESRIARQNESIEVQASQIEALKADLRQSNAQIRQFQDNLAAVQRDCDEMEINLRKQLQIVSIERQLYDTLSKQRARAAPDVEGTKEELSEVNTRHEQEIKELINKHKQELAQQLEAVRHKYVKEREKMLAQIEAGDKSSLIQTISRECERKIDPMRQDHEKQRRDLTAEMAAKQALLTRQYENRIRQMDNANRQQLDIARQSVKDETRKLTSILRSGSI